MQKCIGSIFAVKGFRQHFVTEEGSITEELDDRFWRGGGLIKEEGAVI